MLFFLHKLIDDDCMMYSDSKLVVVDDIAKLWNIRARTEKEDKEEGDWGRIRWTTGNWCTNALLDHVHWITRCMMCHK